jgi:hypothetical protein
MIKETLDNVVEFDKKEAPVQSKKEMILSLFETARPKSKRLPPFPAPNRAMSVRFSSKPV